MRCFLNGERFQIACQMRPSSVNEIQEVFGKDQEGKEKERKKERKRARARERGYEISVE